MLENDERLFDEFKRVDRICGDIFSCRHGISKYIDEMEQIPSYKRRGVPSWDEDYRNLKRVRWLRNQIVHEMAAANCEARDIEWLEGFHARILRQQDPLAAAAKAEQKPPQKRQPYSPTQHYFPNEKGADPKTARPLGKTAVILVGLVGITVVVFVVILAIFLGQLGA